MEVCSHPIQGSQVKYGSSNKTFEKLCFELTDPVREFYQLVRSVRTPDAIDPFSIYEILAHFARRPDAPRLLLSHDRLIGIDEKLEYLSAISARLPTLEPNLAKICDGIPIQMVRTVTLSPLSPLGEKLPISVTTIGTSKIDSLRPLIGNRLSERYGPTWREEVDVLAAKDASLLKRFPKGQPVCVSGKGMKGPINAPEVLTDLDTPSGLISPFLPIDRASALCGMFYIKPELSDGQCVVEVAISFTDSMLMALSDFERLMHQFCPHLETIIVPKNRE